MIYTLHSFIMYNTVYWFGLTWLCRLYVMYMYKYFIFTIAICMHTTATSVLVYRYWFATFVELIDALNSRIPDSSTKGIVSCAYLFLIMVTLYPTDSEYFDHLIFTHMALDPNSKGMYV